MHQTLIRREILDRLLARRGRIHWFDTLDAAKTAVLVIDMQETFCAPGGPAEVPSARGIIGGINTLTAGLRMRGVPVIWVLHANARRGSATDWDLFFNYVVADDVRERTIESLAPGRQRVWGDLVTAPQDLTIIKNRYSALIAGSSGLERELRERGIDTVLIAGTKTNVCCEATARDAMMLDFKVARSPIVVRRCRTMSTRRASKRLSSSSGMCSRPRRFSRDWTTVRACNFRTAVPRPIGWQNPSLVIADDPQ